MNLRPGPGHLTDELSEIKARWETERADWLDLDTIDELSRTGRLHPGFASSWPELRAMILAPGIGR